MNRKYFITRDIDFRAKAVSTGEHVDKNVAGKWLYGYYFESFGLSKIANSLGEFVVQKPTVGQFTGKRDQSGKRIYEGDIADIRYFGGGHTKDMFTPCVCTFGELAFAQDGNFESNGFYFDQIEGPNIFGFENVGEIIGNVFDNQEIFERLKNAMS